MTPEQRRIVAGTVELTASVSPGARHFATVNALLAAIHCGVSGPADAREVTDVVRAALDEFMPSSKRGGVIH